MSEIDELFGVKNHYYIGNYVQCIKETEIVQVKSNDEEILRKSYLYRAYIAQKKYRIVLEELNNKPVAELATLATLATYFSKGVNERTEILEELERKIKMEDDQLMNEIGSKVAATIFMNENQWENALISVAKFVKHDLELMSFAVAIYLKMNRLDLAQKQFQEMQLKDDDATLTQLAQAWIHVSSGTEKLQEAAYIYQELIEKFGMTTLLLNARTAVSISLGNYKDADDDLNDALSKDDDNPDTLINSVIVSKHLKKSDEVLNRYSMQLKDSHFNYPILCDWRQKEFEFNSLISFYKPTKDM